jgi:hypothetical protein
LSGQTGIHILRFGKDMPRHWITVGRRVWSRNKYILFVLWINMLLSSQEAEPVTFWVMISAVLLIVSRGFD